jgi:class 3 adenylate cyclase
MFLEKLCRNRISLPTRICGAFFLFLALVQCFFSQAFAYDTLKLWQYGSLAMVPYILVYDMGYLFFTGTREIRKRYGGISPLECFGRTVTETAIGNLLVGVLVCLGTGVFDILDSLVFHFGITLTRYGFLTFTVGTTLILARRFAFLYSQQQRIIVRSNTGMNTRLVNWIVVQDRDPAELPSVNENNAIMFTDVRNFTGLSEGMPSWILTGFLGALNEVLARPLFDHEDKGAVAYTDKFMGDGMMNIFTDPGVALETAVEIRGQLKQFNHNPRRFFREAPEGFRVNIGTGIAYGPVTLGIMGHSRRVDYTPIGDTVNLASRLESLTKEYFVSIIINDTLHGAVDHSRFNLRHIDRVRVKGRKHPVDIYEEFSADPAPVRDHKQETLPRLTELQEMYFSGRNWEDAVQMGKDMARISLETAKRYGGRTGPADYLPFLYVKRMQAVRKNPELLARGDGVYTFERK